MSSMEENLNLEFRKIPSLQFLYEVNSNGTIIRNVKSKRHIAQWKNGNGYMIARLYVKGKRQTIAVHALVAECWHGTRPDGYVIDHIDRNRINNDYRNLRYVTASENCRNQVRYPVDIIDTRTGARMHFNTRRAAARYIAAQYGDYNETEGAVNNRLYRHRSHIYDYDVIYLNAETACSNQNTTGKEQSTQYLVGTLDRWNDAKRAEERDRVKHGV